MKVNEGLIAVVIAGLSCIRCGYAAGQETARPNVVIILSDDVLKFESDQKLVERAGLIEVLQAQVRFTKGIPRSPGGVQQSAIEVGNTAMPLDPVLWPAEVPAG